MVYWLAGDCKRFSFKNHWKNLKELHGWTHRLFICEEILMSTNGSAVSYISCTPDTRSHGYVVHVVINILKTGALGPINTPDVEVWPLWSHCNTVKLFFSITAMHYQFFNNVLAPFTAYEGIISSTPPLTATAGRFSSLLLRAPLRFTPASLKSTGNQLHYVFDRGLCV